MSEQPITHPVAQPQDHRSPDTFTFQSEAGPVTVPKFKRLMTLGFIRRNRDLAEDQVMFKALEENCNEQELAAVDSIGIHEVETFFNEWRKDSGVGLGESVSS